MPVIQTDRIELRPWTAHAVIAAMAGPTILELALGVRVNLRWPNSEFGEVLSQMADDLVRLGAQGASCLIIVRGAVPEVIGEIGCIGFPDPDGAVEIGFGVVEGYRGQGLATEAVRHFVQRLFIDTVVQRVEAKVEAHNQASKRVLEKAGFRQTSSGGTLLQFEQRRGTWQR